MGKAAKAAAPLGGAAVNGLSDEDDLTWHQIDWSLADARVRRLRQRIFVASRNGNMKQVRNLQKLMLRSDANLLTSVKRVTQTSTGRKTAGIDGQTALTPRKRMALVEELRKEKDPRQARPVKRVYIPKANGKQRPLGIPVIYDRVLQARVKNALEPEWEARFEARSYGFRPGRSAHDAIEAIWQTVGRKASARLWVLDADLSAAFDHIDHDFLLEALGQFPARGLVAQWLKAGVVDRGFFTDTDEGTPQGGVISPLLMNVALHGIEAAAGVRYENPKQNGPQAGLVRVRMNSPVLVRYADDFVVLCHTEEMAQQVRERLTGWLAPRGMKFNEGKTRIVHLTKGFDFLGFTVRRYKNDALLITPSQDAVKRIRRRLTDEVRSLRGANELAVIKRLAPIVRGWSAYYRHACSSDAFSAIDDHQFKVLWRWAKRRHPQHGGPWVKARYFGRFNLSRQTNWVFGHRASSAYLVKFSWTKIERHAAVKGTSSPDDPTLADYWQARRKRRSLPPMAAQQSLLAVKQAGLCPLCGNDLISDGAYEPGNVREWIAWFDTARKALHVHHFLVFRRHDGNDQIENLRLVHAECHRRLHATEDRGRA